MFLNSRLLYYITVLMDSWETGQAQAQADRVPSLQISLTWLVINNLVTGATLHSSEIINIKIYCAS